MNKEKFDKALDEAVLALQDEIVEGNRLRDQASIYDALLDLTYDKFLGAGGKQEWWDDNYGFVQKRAFEWAEYLWAQQVALSKEV